jgi:acyl carrier protein
MQTEPANTQDSDYTSAVRAIVAEHFAMPEDDITLESRIVEDLGADSLDMAELVLVLEGRFGVKILEQDAFGLQTVGDVVAYAQQLSLLSSQQARPNVEKDAEVAS